MAGRNKLGVKKEYDYDPGTPLYRWKLGEAAGATMAAESGYAALAGAGTLKGDARFLGPSGYAGQGSGLSGAAAASCSTGTPTSYSSPRSRYPRRGLSRRGSA